MRETGSLTLRLFGLIACLLTPLVPDGLSAEPKRTTPPASDAEMALLKFRAAPGLKTEVFAAEPLLANPVSFAFDEKGRVFLVETHRRRTSVYDIRRHPDWLDSDFSFRTVADRLNFFKKTLTPENRSLPPLILKDLNLDGQFNIHDLEVESEKIKLLEDRDGDGRAETAATFAEGFQTAVSGVAAGILPRDGSVWFACIPDLWLLRDDNHDGVADFRKPLLHGFGVHISFGGHDLHGLCFGPDGKLYFSIADRGLHVETEGRTIACPDSGAIMRCNPDGSQFELVATGLRNPQELAFDQFGNLWTGDNNGDGGDKARWVYVVEGSDSGWHLGWQHLPKMGAWNSEKLWELHPNNTAAYILPPIAHIGHGPAGLAFYPGTGLPLRYQNHFFLCDFPGGIRSFSLQPKGAAYQAGPVEDFLWELYPVDLAFGPEGGLYVADWIQGWEKTGKGRIYRVFDPSLSADPLILETKQLLAQGMEQRSSSELASLLRHADQRIRQNAQFALASRGAPSIELLAQTSAASTEPLLARLHAIWALGQIAQKTTAPAALVSLPKLLADQEPEVRAQAAKILGDAAYQPALDAVAQLLNDPHPRVRFFAALSLGKMGHGDASELLVELLRNNAGEDPFLRHAAVMGLAWLSDVNALMAAARDASKSVRLGVLLALRRLQRPETAMFLYDKDPSLVLEAARAIYDVPIADGLVQLASLSAQPTLPEPVLRRALNAHFRLGLLENAIALADCASSSSHSESARVEALQLLGTWGAPPPRDRFLGLWRPIPPREAHPASLALRSGLLQLIQSAPTPVRFAAINAAVQLGFNQTTPALRELALDTSSAPDLRAQSLKALAEFKDPRLLDIIPKMILDPEEIIRKEANRLKSQLNPGQALDTLLTTLEQGTLREKQAALKSMATLNDPGVDPILLASLDSLQSGQIMKELQLDLLEAAAQRSYPAIQQKIQDRSLHLAKGSPLDPFRDALHGGDAEAGRALFLERADLACLRCHKVKGEGGEVGPDLSGIGAKHPREYLLESILFPNAKIAPGFETLLITLKDGAAYAGQVKSETPAEIVLNSPEDGLVAIQKGKIQSRDRGLSSMPEDMAKILSKRDLRDLVEFLANLK